MVASHTTHVGVGMKHSGLWVLLFFCQVALDFSNQSDCFNCFSMLEFILFQGRADLWKEELTENEHVALITLFVWEESTYTQTWCSY